MITLTQSAAEQIRKASAEAKIGDDTRLRIAVRRSDDGSLDYAMGFDDTRSEDDVVISQGIEILVSESSRELLDGATLDYVELSPGVFEFIFHNQKDPLHRPAAPGGDR